MSLAPSKYNKIWLGFIIGLLIPIIFFFASYVLFFNHFTLGEYITNTFQFKLLSAITSLCVIPNLLLFFIFIWTNRLLSARGVLMSTIFYGVIVAILRFTA